MVGAWLWLACGGPNDPEVDATPPEETTPSCEAQELVTSDEGFFTDVSESSGIRVDNFYEDPPAGTAINDHSRLAFADIDGDGFDDIVMHSLFPNPMGGVPFEHLVFLNNGDGTFRDHSNASGLREIQAGFFAFGDVDNDGDQDVFAGLDLSGFDLGDHQILLNDGSGVFEALPNAGVGGGSTIAANAVFFDQNGDGNLDLFVGNGGTTYSGADSLFQGNGDGTFTDATDRLSANPARPSNGSTTCDLDDDGDLDVLVSTYSVSTDNGLNLLYDNRGDRLEEVGVERGFASLATGNYWLRSTGKGVDPEPNAEPGTFVGSNGFGLDCGDIDNDGDLDVFLTAISHPVATDYLRKWSDPSQLLINGGADADYVLVNEFMERGLPFNEGDVDGAMIDFDNDGHLDLSMSRDRKYESGYGDNQVDQHAWFGLYRQRADGSFESQGVASGINDPDEVLLRSKSAQNHAWSDIDHDGDLDLLVGGRDQGGGRPNFLFRNDLGQDNRWLAVVVEGDGDNVTRDAFGTRVTLDYGDEVLTREKKSSRGMYNSEDTRVLHFGLGDRDCSAPLNVRWPDGTTHTFDAASLPSQGRVRLVYPDTLEQL